jgi:AraC family transcriptional regulator
MKDARQSSVMQGEFGRITLNLTARDLVEHAHSEYNFIFKIGGGDTGFKVNGSTFELNDDNAIFVNPWEPHAKLSSHGAATLALTALLSGPWMSQVLGVQSPPRAKMFPSPLVQLSPEVRECVVRIAISMTSGLEMSDEERTPILRDLVRAVAVAYCDQEFSKNCLGASPQQYLDWERMTLATRMLSDPNSRVTQVSDELGFSAPSHFARFFAQHIGFPPSDFKRGMLSQASPDQA